MIIIVFWHLTCLTDCDCENKVTTEYWKKAAAEEVVVYVFFSSFFESNEQGSCSGYQNQPV